MIDILRGGALALCFLGALPAQAKAPDANKLAQIMSYCVSAIASDNVKISTRPGDVDVAQGSAGWAPDRDHAMLLSKKNKAWTCEIIVRNPRALLQAARAVIKSIPGAEVQERPDPAGNGKVVAADVCLNSKRIIFRANGAEDKVLGGALMSIQTRPGKVQPC